ncbi:MAG: hypothetical protein KDH96_04145 [Candidatus Riesia sp.]|nr:hypothetical protein [Candidatus Riesia sp.]
MAGEPRFDLYTYHDGAETADLQDIVDELNSATQIVRCFSIDDPGLTLSWEKVFKCGNPGVAVGETMSFPEDKYVQMVLNHEIVTLSADDDSERRVAFRLSAVVMDASGTVTSTIDCTPNPPQKLAIMDCSRFDVNYSWARTFIPNELRTWNTGKGNGYLTQATECLAPGDGYADSGRVGLFLDFYNEAVCYGFLPFPTANRIVPIWEDGQSVLGVNVEDGTVAWRLEGWTETPDEIVETGRDEDGATATPEFGSLSYTRTTYTATVPLNEYKVVVHFTEYFFVMADTPGRVNTNVTRDKTLCDVSTGYYVQADQTVNALAWLEAGAFSSAWPAPLHPQIYRPTASPAFRCVQYPGPASTPNASSDYPNATNLAALESVLDDAFDVSAGRRFLNPEVVDTKHGYMILDVRDGSVISKAYIDNEATLTTFDSGTEYTETYETGSKGFWNKEVVDATGLAHQTAQNSYPDPCTSQPPCEHGAGGCGTADDAEVAFPSGALRLCRPNPLGASFSWFDMPYPVKVPVAGYSGGEFFFTGGKDPYTGPSSDASPFIPALQGVLMLREKEDVAGFEYIDAGWWASDVSYNKPGAFGVFGTGTEVLNKYHWYRFYTAVGEKVFNRPSNWHSCKLAVHPESEEVYAFGRSNQHPILIQTQSSNVSTTWTAEEKTRHNAIVTEGVQGVWKLNITGASVSVAWFKNFHDADVVGAAPDQVVRTSSVGTLVTGIKEPRHGSVISSPFISDDQIICVVEDWSAVTEGAGVPPTASGIKRYIIILDRSNGNVLHKYLISGDALNQEPNNGTTTFTGYGWSHDTIIMANCSLVGQHLALNWVIPDEPVTS